jgi:prepilin-type N-terminal cleavage/methylation domain-containing protein
MKTGFSNQEVVQFPPRGRAGMTLIEVIVALAITGLMVAGIVTGYFFCTTSTVKDSLYMAANARAMERMEETRSAIWAPYRAKPVDDLVATNFPDETNVILDLSGSSSAVTSATLKTDISQILPSPSSPFSAPVRRIRVDCIWQFNGVELVTNTIETCRAPDQ